MKFIPIQSLNLDSVILSKLLDKILLTLFIFVIIWVSQRLFSFIFKRLLKSERSYIFSKASRYIHFMVKISIINALRDKAKADIMCAWSSLCQYAKNQPRDDLAALTIRRIFERLSSSSR
ncbi:MAG: hypothetical protein VXX85_00085, partial [Candidatus Margulisiibacteriota bacterium]|nr:hypothetical protein [Candidatus Margulisiibacteriota bacterium]